MSLKLWALLLNTLIITWSKWWRTLNSSQNCVCEPSWPISAIRTITLEPTRIEGDYAGDSPFPRKAILDESFAEETVLEVGMF
jgi:hypothetical protein